MRPRLPAVPALARVPAAPLALGFLLLLPGHRLIAGDFAARFEHFKAQAAPADLYRFLYAMPKAGDLHHHAGGSWRMEDLYAVATDPRRNGGNRFYTRLRAGGCPDETNAWRKFQTIAAFTWKELPACAREEFTALDALAPAQRDAFINSLRLDAPGEGRQEFFEEIWPRLGALGRSMDVFLEMTVETMKRYGAEGVRYLEPQTIPLGLLDARGGALDPGEFHQRLKARLDQPDARATGVAVRWQVVVLRFTPVAEKMVEEAYDFVSRHRDLWVGINMAGREDNDKGHPRRFLETYRRMRHRHAGIGLAIHVRGR
ncbi:MAG: hypothetical protein ACKO3N_02565 [Verrucomicrobiota bacterium]